MDLPRIQITDILVGLHLDLLDLDVHGLHLSSKIRQSRVAAQGLDRDEVHDLFAKARAQAAEFLLGHELLVLGRQVKERGFLHIP